MVIEARRPRPGEVDLADLVNGDRPTTRKHDATPAAYLTRRSSSYNACFALTYVADINDLAVRYRGHGVNAARRHNR